MSVEASVNRILSSSAPSEQLASLTRFVDEVVGSASIPNLQATLTCLLQSQFVSGQVHRAIVLHFANNLSTLPGPVFEKLAIAAITAFRQSTTNFDDSDFVLREALFNYFVAQEEFKVGAQYLAGINVDSSTKELTDVQKANIQVKCAEAFLEEDEALEAEIFVNKASIYMNAVTDWALQLRYRVTAARVMDANRKFIDAAVRYYELSTTSHGNVNQRDLLELLGKGITCAVLGKVSSQRTRVLAQLVKDDRLARLEELPHYAAHSSVLRKMCGGQLLRPEELAAFEESLLPHQKAISADGFTIPQKAVIEHNLLAASRIYMSIYFTELAALLRLPVDKVEKVVAKMISEDRLVGSIDQTEGLVFFENDVVNEIAVWNSSIGALCEEVSGCVEYLELNYKNQS